MRQVLLLYIYFWTGIAMCDQGPEIRYQYLYVEEEASIDAVPNAVSIQGLTRHFDWLRAHEYTTEKEVESSSNKISVRIVFEYVEPQALPHLLALLELYDYRAVVGVSYDWLTKVIESQVADTALALRQLLSSKRIEVALDLLLYGENQSDVSSRLPANLLSVKKDPAKLITTGNKLRQLIINNYNVNFNHVLWPVGYYDAELANDLTEENFSGHIWSHRHDKLRVGPHDRIGFLVGGNRLADLVSMLETPLLFIHRGIQVARGGDNHTLSKIAMKSGLNAAWSDEQAGPRAESTTAGHSGNKVDWYIEVSSLASLESFRYPILTRGVSTVIKQPDKTLQVWVESVAEQVAQKSPTAFIGTTIPFNGDALLTTATLIESRALDFVVLHAGVTDIESCTNTALIVQSFTSDTNLSAVDRARLVFRIDIGEANIEATTNCLQQLRYAGARSVIVRTSILNNNLVNALKRTISLKLLPNELFIEASP